MCVSYLVNKNIVEVIGEASGKSVSEFSKQQLLLRHSHQFFMSCKWEQHMIGKGEQRLGIQIRAVSTHKC